MFRHLHWAISAKGFIAIAVLLVSAFSSIAACPGQAENADATKVELLGGKIKKDSEGNVWSILLLGKTKSPLVGFSDVDIESIDFANFCRLTHLTVISGRFTAITDRSLVQFEKIPTQLEMLDISMGQITDKGLIKLLRKQKSLYYCVLMETPISDQSLPAISCLKNLQVLVLERTNITSKGLRELVKLKHLRVLSLKRTDVSDAGLVEIAKLTSLTHLNLDGANVTDAGIQQIGTLTNLRRLELRSTKVTDKGIEVLQKQLPSLKIER